MFGKTPIALAHRLKRFCRMRKRHRVLFLAALVAALVVPVGFALSLDSTPVIRSAVASPALLPSWSMPDGAKLFVVGIVLFGLAAAVRKAS